MSQTASSLYPHFSVPKEIRIAGHESDGRVWPWRDTLLLMFIYCALVWAGIGLLVAKLTG